MQRQIRLSIAARMRAATSAFGTGSRVKLQPGDRRARRTIDRRRLVVRIWLINGKIKVTAIRAV